MRLNMITLEQRLTSLENNIIDLAQEIKRLATKLEGDQVKTSPPNLKAEAKTLLVTKGLLQPQDIAKEGYLLKQAQMTLDQIGLEKFNNLLDQVHKTSLTTQVRNMYAYLNRTFTNELNKKKRGAPIQ